MCHLWFQAGFREPCSAPIPLLWDVPAWCLGCEVAALCAWQPVEERVEGGPEGSCQKPAPHLLEPGSTAIPSCRRVWEVMRSPDERDAEGSENSLVTQLWGRSHETATIISQGQLLLIQHILKSPLLHPLREKPGPCGLCSGGLFLGTFRRFLQCQKALGFT